MPSNATAKTKSAPKAPKPQISNRRVTIAILGGLLIVCLLAFVASMETKLHFRAPDGRHFMLQRAASDLEQQRGLSGTKSLPKDGGMIFLYNREDKRCFWMKDMHYSLDIIWADASKRVTAIEKELSPDTYPDTFCAQGQYIIELNAGEAERSGIVEGKRLQF